MSTSIVEAEHIAASNCCAQILRMRNQLQSYGLVRRKMHIMYDNSSDITISNNLVQTLQDQAH